MCMCINHAGHVINVTLTDTSKSKTCFLRVNFVVLFKVFIDKVMIFVDIVKIYMSRLVGKPTMWFPNRSYTNRAVQKMARDLKFWV